MMTTQIPEIGAEMLLNYLYPELEDRWIAHHDGAFYRNYSRDVMELSPEENTVWLSRDGFLDLLPQGLLSREDSLKTGDIQEKHKELERQLRILSEAFLPFDSLAFRRRLKLERNLSEVLEGKLSYVLKTYFGVDLEAQENPYVREFAVLLPYVRQWRGDFGQLKSLLSAVFHCPVAMKEGRYSETDSTREWLPVVRYELLVPGLSAAEFQALYTEVKPLEAVLSEWFVPMEVRLELAVREHTDASRVNSRLTLDYNTEL